MAVLWLAISVCGLPLQAQDLDSTVVEQDSFRLHWVSRAVGMEHYQVVRQGVDVLTEIDFEFTDRGTSVPLSAELVTAEDYTPSRLTVEGKVARRVAIDLEVEVAQGKARVTDGDVDREVDLPSRYFTVAGYAPITVQMMLLRYWEAHGRPDRLQVFPSSTVTIESRGRDRVQVGDRARLLDRYSIGGLIWGHETVWTDTTGTLVAAVTIDGEGDQFEAIRVGYEEALEWFVARAAEDGLDRLGDLAPGEPLGDRPLALIGGRVITGVGDEPLEDAVVLIRGGRIEAVGSRHEVVVPADARVIELDGQTVAPGLWDMHAHLAQVEWGPVYLAAGITTVRDVGNDVDFVRAMRDASASGQGPAPRILVAGVIFGDEVSTVDEAKALVRSYHEAGFEQIKIYSFVKPDLVPVITEQAHTLGMSVTGHIPQGMDLFSATEAGMDQINHISFVEAVMVRNSEGDEDPVPVGPESPEGGRVIEWLAERRIVVDPTIALYELHGRSIDDPLTSFEPGAARVAPELAGPLEGIGIAPEESGAAREALERRFGVIKALHEAGVTIVAGTDMAIPGHSLYRELELYVDGAGFTPLEALRAATSDAAAAMGLEDETGTIEVGKRADLIVLDRDPLADIGNIRSVTTVIAAGRIYDSAEMWRLVGFTP
jgi:imidazolonepropionase-like amidohydrolase